MKMNIIVRILIFSLTLLVSACAVGPDYVRPTVAVPAQFKEAPKGWKIAQPQDACDRGEWWKVFNEPQLNALEAQLNISNQTIATAAAQYQQASALVDEARASYFPTLTSSITVTRQNSGAVAFATASPTATVANPGSGSGGSSSNISTSRTLLLNAAWEPDLWGSVRRSVEASAAGAQASAAQLALVRLTAQASLAQYYFELRALDTDQELLDNTVKDYQTALKLTQNRYAAGVAGQTDVVQAQSQLESAQAAAINNGITRAQYEHAIAVLIGEPPAAFSFAYHPLTATPPVIPVAVPSMLLERRPDIAQDERLMAQANAQVGVAVAAYFPALTLSATGSGHGNDIAHWFSLPDAAWSIGPQLAETIFDGGLRRATTAAARANYNATVATYRQTVLAAFQDVEDNLASLRILTAEAVVQDQAAASARRALQLEMNQYKAGTVAYSDVITAQINAYTAEKNAADITGLRMTSAVGLIRSLGGGWDANTLN